MKNSFLIKLLISFIKNIRFISFIFFIFLQGSIVLLLFNKSLEIDGDIVNYLKFIAGGVDIEYEDIEPASLIVFKIIGVFPNQLQFIFLFLIIFCLMIIESVIVYKNTQFSLLWVIFFTICVVPFFHAINLRTGFGMFFLFLFYKNIWGILLTPFFHSSFFPVLFGIRFKPSIINIFLIILSIMILGSVLRNLILNKISAYYGYYLDGESTYGLLVEIICIIIFTINLKKKYKLVSTISWYRFLFFIVLISLISIKLAMISSRFVTLVYLILLMIRINSIEINNKNYFSTNNISFYSLFCVLILFRIYRIVTMFGFIQLNKLN